MKANAKIFALYKGDEFLDVGTIDEIARRFNVARQTILFYGTQAYKNRKKNSKKCKILIELDEFYEEF